METNSGGVTNINGGSVSTTGQDAHALVVSGAGSTVNLSGVTALSTQGNGAFGIYAALGGVVSATGTLNVETTNAGAVAVGLQGNGASVLATGGGSIVSAGTAIAFLAGRTRSRPSTISTSTTRPAT